MACCKVFIAIDHRDPHYHTSVHLVGGARGTRRGANVHAPPQRNTPSSSPSCHPGPHHHTITTSHKLPLHQAAAVSASTSAHPTHHDAAHTQKNSSPTSLVAIVSSLCAPWPAGMLKQSPCVATAWHVAPPPARRPARPLAHS